MSADDFDIPQKPLPVIPAGAEHELKCSPVLRETFGPELSVQVSQLVKDGHADLVALLNQEYTKVEASITALQEQRIADSRKWADQYAKTYEYLKREVQLSCKEGRLMDTTIHGPNVSGRGLEPTIATWCSANQGRIAAINFIFRKLRAKGWDPIMGEISHVDYDRDDSWYSGGEYVHIRCDFSPPT